ncbi:MAG: hypothetical protein JW955_16150 [Sedimentisphaerales bacterium]|nr:hypothetical protein [Sedimentisphaerales bacterium]
MAKQIAWVLCILWTGPALALDDDAELVKSLLPLSWEIIPEVSVYTYREPGVMKNKGIFYSIAGSYTRWRLHEGDPAKSDADGGTPMSWSLARIEARFGFGDVDYDGSYMDGTPLESAGNDDIVVDARVMWGMEWQGGVVVDAFYAGIGYRYLSDDSSSQPGGYLRESNYLYLPIGSRADFDLKGGWAFGLTGEIDVLLVGYQVSHLNDVDPRYPQVRNWQWPGVGLRGGVALRHRGTSLEVTVSPFVRYWWIAESDTSDGYYEPENNTFEYGLSAAFRF